MLEETDFSLFLKNMIGWYFWFNNITAPAKKREG
jgi:hypothetical protein